MHSFFFAILYQWNTKWGPGSFRGSPEKRGIYFHTQKSENKSIFIHPYPTQWQNVITVWGSPHVQRLCPLRSDPGFKSILWPFAACHPPPSIPVTYHSSPVLSNKTMKRPNNKKLSGLIHLKAKSLSEERDEIFSSWPNLCTLRGSFMWEQFLTTFSFHLFCVWPKVSWV